MTKRRWVVLLLILLTVSFVGLFPPTRIRIVGFFRGESFYAGLPTGYWREQAMQYGGRVEEQFRVFKSQMNQAKAFSTPDWTGHLRNFVTAGKRTGADTRVFMGDPAATEVLLELLKDREAVVRENACFGLAKIGPPASEAVPDLIQLFESDEKTVADEASQALHSILRAKYFEMLERKANQEGEKSTPTK